MRIDNIEDEEVISIEIDTDSGSETLLQVLELRKLMLRTENMEKKMMTPSHNVKLIWSFC